MKKPVDSFMYGMERVALRREIKKGEAVVLLLVWMQEWNRP